MLELMLLAVKLDDGSEEPLNPLKIFSFHFVDKFRTYYKSFFFLLKLKQIYILQILYLLILFLSLLTYLKCSQIKKCYAFYSSVVTFNNCYQMYIERRSITTTTGNEVLSAVS